MRITVTMLLGMLLTTVQAISSAATNATDISACEEYATARNTLSQIYEEYSSLPMNPNDAEKLFIIFRKVEEATQKIHALYPVDYSKYAEQYLVISECLWNDNFNKIGLFVGHYSDRLEYSEKLLADAHRLNPVTQYRKYTLYTAILGKDIGTELGNFPNVEQANLYLKEFPNGPYATKVYRILAGFYHDLYMSLRYGEKVLGESNSCYEEYIADHPKEDNPEQARMLGILYFKKVIQATPVKDSRRRTYLSEMNALKKGISDNVINWCTD